MSRSMRGPLVTPRDLEILGALDQTPLTAGQLLALSRTFAPPFSHGAPRPRAAPGSVRQWPVEVLPLRNCGTGCPELLPAHARRLRNPPRPWHAAAHQALFRAVGSRAATPHVLSRRAHRPRHPRRPHGRPSLHGLLSGEHPQAPRRRRGPAARCIIHASHAGRPRPFTTLSSWIIPPSVCARTRTRTVGNASCGCTRRSRASHHNAFVCSSSPHAAAIGWTTFSHWHHSLRRIPPARSCMAFILSGFSPSPSPCAHHASSIIVADPVALVTVRLAPRDDAACGVCYDRIPLRHSFLPETRHRTRSPLPSSRAPTRPPMLGGDAPTPRQWAARAPVLRLWRIGTRP